MRPLALLLTTSIMAATLASPAIAKQEGPAFISMGVPSDAPQGYVEMCRRDPNFCGQLEGRSKADVLASVAVAERASVPLTDGATAAGAVSRNSISARMGAGFASRILAQIHSQRTNGAPAVAPAALAPQPALLTLVPHSAAPIEMTQHSLVKFNNDVNRAIIQRTDFDIYGVPERWSRPIGNGKALGDCEDIAIEKRARLVESGADPRSMAMAVVYSRFRGLHTVLVVRLADGDYVLDSLSSKVRLWSDTDYVWLRVQNRENPGTWYSVERTNIVRAPFGGYFGRDDLSQGDEG